MGHKYNRRDGTWQLISSSKGTDLVVRQCPICGFSQPLNAFSLGMAEFSQCPKCRSKLDLPKKITWRNTNGNNPK